ncbi:hypothetical protein CTAYLR_002016 [Chrysophaeum taylorii]|uniref:HSF-type DNA-binding domain-containing protein n=1 Tax=Chrysophaeum taylorii TaxID=2483200 RepID=A0AAD7UAP7_9STRA|nr:hypothetical protein CTAYLR_002016 [Chrysophaeum taylorii]
MFAEERLPVLPAVPEATRETTRIDRKSVKPRARQAPSFALNLHKLVKERPDLIEVRDGALVIFDRKKLTSQLVNFFRTASYASFQRQLNNFGFLMDKVASGTESVYVKTRGAPLHDARDVATLRPVRESDAYANKKKKANRDRWLKKPPPFAPPKDAPLPAPIPDDDEEPPRDSRETNADTLLPVLAPGDQASLADEEEDEEEEVDDGSTSTSASVLRNDKTSHSPESEDSYCVHIPISVAVNERMVRCIFQLAAPVSESARDEPVAAVTPSEEHHGVDTPPAYSYCPPQPRPSCVACGAGLEVSPSTMPFCATCLEISHRAASFKTESPYIGENDDDWEELRRAIWPLKSGVVYPMDIRARQPPLANDSRLFLPPQCRTRCSTSYEPLSPAPCRPTGYSAVPGGWHDTFDHRPYHEFNPPTNNSTNGRLVHATPAALLAPATMLRPPWPPLEYSRCAAMADESSNYETGSASSETGQSSPPSEEEPPPHDSLGDDAGFVDPDQTCRELTHVAYNELAHVVLDDDELRTDYLSLLIEDRGF